MSRLNIARIRRVLKSKPGWAIVCAATACAVLARTPAVAQDKTIDLKISLWVPSAHPQFAHISSNFHRFDSQFFA